MVASFQTAASYIVERETYEVLHISERNERERKKKDKKLWQQFTLKRGTESHTYRVFTK